MSILTSFFDSVKSTLEGNDGKISSRKSTAFWFVLIATIEALSIIIIVWLIVTKQITVTSDTIGAMRILYDFYFATLGMILLLFGIISIAQVQNLKTIVKAEEKKEETEG